MKNADMPAMPQDYTLYCEGIGECPTLGTGLTKREHFAAMAMQGLAAGGHDNAMAVASQAVTMADYLLKELES